MTPTQPKPQHTPTPSGESLTQTIVRQNAELTTLRAENERLKSDPLVIAAPDLLDACKHALFALGGTVHQTSIVKLSDAIKKAGHGLPKRRADL